MLPASSSSILQLKVTFTYVNHNAKFRCYSFRSILAKSILECEGLPTNHREVLMDMLPRVMCPKLLPVTSLSISPSFYHSSLSPFSVYSHSRYCLSDPGACLRASLFALLYCNREWPLPFSNSDGHPAHLGADNRDPRVQMAIFTCYW
jgi:hypothetical protein